MVTEKHIGWVITKEHDTTDDEPGRVGYGQGMGEANNTAASYAGIVGRTIFMESGIDPKTAIPKERAVKWRSFSDDGDPAYDGLVDIDWLFPDEPLDDFTEDDPAYNIDRFCMEDWGATVVVYNAADIRRCRPRLVEYVARHPRMERTEWLKTAGIDKDAWLPIYG